MCWCLGLEAEDEGEELFIRDPNPAILVGVIGPEGARQCLMCVCGGGVRVRVCVCVCVVVCVCVFVHAISRESCKGIACMLKLMHYIISTRFLGFLVGYNTGIRFLGSLVSYWHKVLGHGFPSRLLA